MRSAGRVQCREAARAVMIRKLAAGQKVRSRDFEAGSRVGFNVHCHVGSEVVSPVKLPAAASAGDTLEVEVGQACC